MGTNGVNGPNDNTMKFNIDTYIKSKKLSKEQESVFTEALQKFDINKDHSIDAKEYKKFSKEFLNTFVDIEVTSDINSRDKNFDNEVKKQDLNDFIESEIQKDLDARELKRKSDELNQFIETVIKKDLQKRGEKSNTTNQEDIKKQDFGLN